MKKILICFGMAFIIPLSHLLAEPSAVDPTETKQSGSVYSFNAAVTQSNLIFSGKIANLGKIDLRGAGTFVYDMALANISAIYLGSSEPNITVSIRVKQMTTFLFEETPQVGESYIFFIKHKGRRNFVVKLLSATDANIAKVKALIAAAPAPK